MLKRNSDERLSWEDVKIKICSFIADIKQFEVMRSEYIEKSVGFIDLLMDEIDSSIYTTIDNNSSIYTSIENNKFKGTFNILKYYLLKENIMILKELSDDPSIKDKEKDENKKKIKKKNEEIY